MSDRKYTPGPWRLERNAILGPNGETVLEAFHTTNDQIALEGTPGNEALILAAPRLLAELKAVTDSYEELLRSDRMGPGDEELYPPGFDAVRRARGVIAASEEGDEQP